MAVVSLMTPEIRKLRLGTYRPRQHSGMLTQQLYKNPGPESTFSCRWHDGGSASPSALATQLHPFSGQAFPRTA